MWFLADKAVGETLESAVLSKHSHYYIITNSCLDYKVLGSQQQEVIHVNTVWFPSEDLKLGDTFLPQVFIIADVVVFQDNLL